MQAPLQKGLKIGQSNCIQMFKTSELPGAPPPGPKPGTPPGGPQDPMPILYNAPLALLATL